MKQTSKALGRGRGRERVGFGGWFRWLVSVRWLASVTGVGRESVNGRWEMMWANKKSENVSSRWGEKRARREREDERVREREWAGERGANKQNPSSKARKRGRALETVRGGDCQRWWWLRVDDSGGSMQRRRMEEQK